MHATKKLFKELKNSFLSSFPLWRDLTVFSFETEYDVTRGRIVLGRVRRKGGGGGRGWTQLVQLQKGDWWWEGILNGGWWLGVVGRKGYSLEEMRVDGGEGGEPGLRIWTKGVSFTRVDDLQL